jgi:hypothetical protein
MRREAEIARNLNHPSVTTYMGLFVKEEVAFASDEQPDYYLVALPEVI